MSAGHSLMLVWALWSGLEAWTGDTAMRNVDASMIERSYETRDQCLAAAISKRRVRNAMVWRSNGKDHVGIAVFACLEEGADPTLATFE